MGNLNGLVNVSTGYKNMRAFDDLVTAPASGFKNADHYYEECSTFNQLHLVKVPTMLMTSEDDPFVSIEHYRRAKLSSKVQLHIEKVGGHMGYVSKGSGSFSLKPWLDFAISKYINSLCSG